MNSVFSQYHPAIQQMIWKKGWQALTSVQERAGTILFETGKDLLVVSGTATGKTEAVFFPLLTEVVRHPGPGIRILYVSPLKALVNDQYSRLRKLCSQLGIVLTSWHGDSSWVRKQQLLDRPQGILQITPESLEALFLGHPGQIWELFCNVDAIVIDEVHAFAGTDRGIQLQCLLARLEQVLERPVRRIGLSATVQDKAGTAAWLSGGGDVEIVQTEGEERTFSVGLQVFAMPEAADRHWISEPMLEAAAQCCRSWRTLIFCNSRGLAEACAAGLQGRTGHWTGIHHSHVSASLRQQTEAQLKAGGPLTVVTTSSLELGIDIGDIGCIVQLDAPLTCSSFVQRLGRSGRTDGHPRILFLVRQVLTDLLPWDFLKTLAVTGLYVRERYTEPVQVRKKAFDLAAHQTLAVLAQHNGLSPAVLAGHILAMPSFQDILPEEYVQLLRTLKEAGWIQQLANGQIIPSDKAGRLMHHHSFFAVFETADEWRVVHGREIGKVSGRYEEGDCFRLAGACWKVERVEEDRLCLYVVPAGRGEVPRWQSDRLPCDGKVMEEIRALLRGREPVLPLSEVPARMLELARQRAGQEHLLEDGFCQTEEGAFRIIWWGGEERLEQMAILLKSVWRSRLKVTGVEREGAAITFTSLLEEKELLQAIERAPVSSRPVQFRKHRYGFLAGTAMMNRSAAANGHDLAEAAHCLKRLAERRSV